MGSRFRYSGKTEFQSTMIRAQQLNQANENKSNFERRPSQRFASRRSRMDRTRPNITSSSSSTAVTANKNSNLNSNNNNHSTKDNNVSAVISKPSDTNSLPNNKPTNESQAHQATVKPNLVISGGNPRHQLSNSKPVRPPTVPPSASFGVTQLKPVGQQQKSTQPAVSINNNNILHQASDRRSDFTETDTVKAAKTHPTSERLDHNLPTVKPNASISHAHSKSQQIPIKSHHTYINYKPPDTQPPPPPKDFDKGYKELQRVTISDEDHSESKIRRVNRSTASDQLGEGGHVSLNGPAQRSHQAEKINSSSMPPPPPPPPHKAPRSMSGQLLNQINKQPHHHSQSGLIKPICVTEL